VFPGVKTLPVEYENNRKAWMTTRKIFTDWVKKLDRQMRRKNRKIKLFVDNCAAHEKIDGLTNVELCFLPANTTSKLQPLDQGIIANFKVYFRKEVLRHVLACHESN